MAELGAGQIVAGRFRLETRLGEGGMGSVWAAVHTTTGKRVAIKILRPELAKRADVRARFFREAKVSCSIQHDAILPIHDVLDLDDSPALVMDVLVGEPLSAVLARTPRIPLPLLQQIFAPLVSALQAAHAAGVVHRDLKPENIFLVRRSDGRMEPRLLDFGIAKLLDDATASLDQQVTGITKTGTLVGTPEYMSPEQVTGKPVDARSDLWSLGVILYDRRRAAA